MPETLVAWHSPEYQSSLDATREHATGMDEGIYGVHILRYVEYDREVDPFGVRATELLDEEKLRLADAIGDSALYAANRHALGQLKQDLADAGTVVAEGGAQSVAQSVRDLDAPMFESFLRVHIDNERRREAGFQEQALQFKHRYIEAFEEAITAGRLPSTIDIKVIAQRIDRMRVVGVDPLGNNGQASYDEHTHSLHVARAEWDWADPGMVQEEDGEPVSLFHIASHEASHGVGGKAVAEHEEGHEVIRSGVQGLPLDEEPLELDWLEEALTEKLNIRVSNKTDSGLRNDERAFLDRFLAGGRKPISENLALEAFLEDTRPGQAQESAWDRFRAEIAQAYDPGFLRRLDAYLSVAGDQHALMRAAGDYIEGAAGDDEFNTAAALGLQR